LQLTIFRAASLQVHKQGVGTNVIALNSSQYDFCVYRQPGWIGLDV